MPSHYNGGKPVQTYLPRLPQQLLQLSGDCSRGSSLSAQRAVSQQPTALCGTILQRVFPINAFNQLLKMLPNHKILVNHKFIKEDKIERKKRGCLSKSRCNLIMQSRFNS